MNRTGSHRHPGHEGARSRALPDRLRRAPQGARRPARRAGHDPRRVGSLHVLDPHRGSGHGEVQGPHRRRHLSTRKWTRSPACRGRSSSTAPTRRSSRRSKSATRAGKVMRKYHMPSHAHLMIEDGDTVLRRPGARQDSARDDQDQGHHGRSAARRRAVRGAQAARDGGHLGNRRHRPPRRHRQGAAQDHHRPRTRVASRESTRCRAACTSTSRKATASGRASR